MNKHMFHKVHTMETGIFVSRLKNLLNPLNFHCPYYNLNFCIKTETVTVGADATGYVCFFSLLYIQTKAVASDQAMTGSVFWAEIQNTL